MFCLPNETISNIWVDGSFSHCFFETIPISVYSFLLILLGGIQLIYYFKCSSPTLSGTRPMSVFFLIQIMFTIILALIAILRFCLQAFLFNDGIYGSMVLNLSLNLLCWSFSICLIYLERNFMITSRIIKGHGIPLLLFWNLVFITENLALVNVHSERWWFKLGSVENDCEFSLFIFRYVFTLTLCVVGFYAPGLPPPQTYGQLSENTGEETTAPSTWKNVGKKIFQLVPFMWPKKSGWLQLSVIFSFFLLILGRVANVFVPIYYKLIVNSLGSGDPSHMFCWPEILVYVFLKFLQGGGTGGMGFLNNLRSLLWISVQQYTSREVQVNLFAHLHSLSLRWHLSRKTGEVLRIMDRGTASINQLLSYIVFNILPTIFDVLIAVVYFTAVFDIWFGLIVFSTMATYLLSTILVTEWRTKYRRSMNLADNEQRTRGVDSLLNYETVKYYGAEPYEINRYQDAILSFQTEEWKSNATLCLLNTAQNIIINGGLLVGSLYCAWIVSNGEFTVGDYVLFSTYIIQLYSPLNWFGTYYRMIQQSFIDMENMFDLLDEKKEVVDMINPIEFTSPKGLVEFKNVSFHYIPENPILKNVSFIVHPGMTLAVVGPTGAGKSTIIRLLFRFFDVTEGSIAIDGIDIRSYSQKSLRKTFGVVPQDTVLFNDTISYNIKYGCLEASEEDIVDAAKNAEIHPSIEGFAEGYQTKVGERGLKVSGGEKQRIAIARTILKAPQFILLDEATSALDTNTERNIQAALNRISSGRTTVVVAHRLSTIVHSDAILVLKDGSVAEMGTHEDLLDQNGIYAGMWNQQLENIKDNGSDKP